MLRWLGKNIGTFFLALVLAIGVWVAAVNAENPNEERTHPQLLPIEIVGQDPALLITNNYTEYIELTLLAPKSTWEQLVADTNGVRVLIDLSGLPAGEYDISPQIQIGYQPSKIITYTPNNIRVVLEEIITIELPIETTFKIEPSVGYKASTPYLSTNKIEITGPSSLVEQVDHIQASYTKTEARESIEETLPLRALDKDGKVVNGITLNPKETTLKVSINQQGGYRDMAVKAVIEGQVAEHYRLTNISVSPLIVTVYSPDAQLVNELPGIIETEALNIDNASEDISSRLKLILPEGISIIGDQSILVQIDVEAILSSITIYDIPLEIINIDPSLAAQLSSDTVDVIISGPLPILDTFTTESLRVTLDVAGLTIGDHQLTPQVELLNDKIKVESILPESIEVHLSKALTPTPPSP